MLKNITLQGRFIDRAMPIPSEFKVASKAKKITSNPLNQFLIFGILLMLIQIIAMVAPDILPKTYVNVVTSVVIYAIMSVGFCLLLGYSGLASLGTAGFVGIGSYIAFFTMREWGMPYFSTFLIAAFVSVLLGVAVGFISLRIEGIYLAIITLGLSEVIRYALKAIYNGTVKLSFKDLKLFGIDVGKEGMYFLVCIMFIALLIIVHNIINSPTGRAMLAMKNSTSAAQAYGISLMKFRLLAFVIATVFATLAGTAWMISGNALSPSSEAEIMLKLTLSLNVLAAVIIGGYRSIWGTIFGAFFVFGLSSILALSLPYELYTTISPYISVFIGVLMIVVVMFFPGGIAQLIVNLKYKHKINKLKRKVYKYGAEE